MICKKNENCLLFYITVKHRPKENQVASSCFSYPQIFQVHIMLLTCVLFVFAHAEKVMDNKT